MATRAQINANRQNAQKSTGPKTQNGKSIVSKNALKNGHSAIQDVISTESQEEFDLYRDRIFEEFSPATTMESMLTERIVTISWRLKRIGRIQNQTIEAMKAKKISPLKKMAESYMAKQFGQPYPDPDESAPELALGRLALKDFDNSRVLDRLLMYERRLENSLYKTLLELQKLQLTRKLKPLNPDSDDTDYIAQFKNALFN